MTQTKQMPANSGQELTGGTTGAIFDNRTAQSIAQGGAGDKLDSIFFPSYYPEDADIPPDIDEDIAAAMLEADYQDAIIAEALSLLQNTPIDATPRAVVQRLPDEAPIPIEEGWELVTPSVLAKTDTLEQSVFLSIGEWRQVTPEVFFRRVAPVVDFDTGTDGPPIRPGLAILPDDDDEPEVHPLDVTTPPLSLGWIDEYAELMTKLTGSPREFNVVCGLVTAAAAIQRKAVLRMSFADIYPNIYAAIIARSSVYHKSSALHKPRSLLQRAALDRLMLSELMTSEGLLAQLQGQPSGLVIRDEIGTLFDSHAVKYLRTLKPDLTALFDCLPYSRQLSNSQIKVDAPYLNILGATTPARFYDAITATDWQDGFMARWLFVLPEGEPDFDAMTGMHETQHDEAIRRLALTLQDLDRRQKQDFILAPDAFTLWDGWQRQAAKDAYYFGDDTIAAFVTRYSAYALKFALILASVNGEWGQVTLRTMQTAIHLADSFKRSVARLLREKSEHLVSGEQLQKVFKAIKANNTEGQGVATKTIMQRANMRKTQLTPSLEKLAEIGAIASKKVGNGTRYWTTTEELPVRTWK